MVVSTNFYKRTFHCKMENFQQLVLPWLLVLVFIIHDGEEAIFLPRWVQKNPSLFDALEIRFPIIRRPLRLLRDNNQRQFVFSVLVLLCIITLFTCCIFLYPDSIAFQYIFIGISAVFTLHLLVHIIQSLFLRKIVPGTITSILVFLPSQYLWQHLVQTAQLTFIQSSLLVMASVIFFLPVFVFALRLGNWAGRKPLRNPSS